MKVPKRLIQARVRLISVSENLALQYTFEGACGPSSLALILSALREVAALTKHNVAAGQPVRKLPVNLSERIFRGVRDEDVVVGVQLVHNGML